MDDDDRELARRWFVVTTERLETAHEFATEGQDRLTAESYVALADRIQAVANEIITLSASDFVVVDRSNGGGAECVENQA